MLALFFSETEEETELAGRATCHLMASGITVRTALVAGHTGGRPWRLGKPDLFLVLSCFGFGFGFFSFHLFGFFFWFFLSLLGNLVHIYAMVMADGPRLDLVC